MSTDLKFSCLGTALSFIALIFTVLLSLEVISNAWPVIISWQAMGILWNIFAVLLLKEKTKHL